MSSPLSDPEAHACIDHVVEDAGQFVCTRCGIVLDGSVFADEWRPNLPEVTTREWKWRKAVKTFLGVLGAPHVDASSFAPPPTGGNVPYRVLVAYAYWLRFARDLPSGFARAASQATSKEWQRAARVYGVRDEEADATADAEMTVELERICRRHGLARGIAEAATRAMQEPRLETRDPRHVLMATVAESLGDDLTARIFAVPATTVRRYREVHDVAAFAVSLEAEGLALKAHVERCESFSPADETLQRHVRS